MSHYFKWCTWYSRWFQHPVLCGDCDSEVVLPYSVSGAVGHVHESESVGPDHEGIFLCGRSPKKITKMIHCLHLRNGQQFKFWIKVLDAFALGVTFCIYRYRRSDDFHAGEGLEVAAVLIESTLGTVLIAALSIYVLYSMYGLTWFPLSLSLALCDPDWTPSPICGGFGRFRSRGSGAHFSFSFASTICFWRQR